MKKRVTALFIIVSMIMTTTGAFAASNYNITPSQTVPAPVNNSATSYPVPQDNYNTRQYDDYNSQYTYGGNEYAYGNNNYGNGYNNNNGNYSNYGNNGYQGRVIYVPAKTVITAISMTPLSTETSKTGDSVVFYIPSDFYYNNDLIAPAGSRINGTVVKVGRGTYGNKNGKLQVRFTNITTTNGQVIPLTASIETEDGSGILKAGTIKDSSKVYARDAIIGAAGGAILGVIGGAIGGNVGKGAIIGTATGGATGIMTAVLDKGDNIEIPQNSQMNIVLDQPLTYSGNSTY